MMIIYCIWVTGFVGSAKMTYEKKDATKVVLVKSIEQHNLLLVKQRNLISFNVKEILHYAELMEIYR